jgi:hypothetical protein
MRTLSALAFSALLLTGTATTSLAVEPSSVVWSNVPSTERVHGDGDGMSRPIAPSSDHVNGDGDGMSNPVVPVQESDLERWA